MIYLTRLIRQVYYHPILDVMHTTAQGVIAGANMVLVDFHPEPDQALVDGPQALLLEELPYFLEDVQIAREAFEQRVALAERYNAMSKNLKEDEEYEVEPQGV